MAATQSLTNTHTHTNTCTHPRTHMQVTATGAACKNTHHTLLFAGPQLFGTRAAADAVSAACAAAASAAVAASLWLEARRERAGSSLSRNA